MNRSDSRDTYDNDILAGCSIELAEKAQQTFETAISKIQPWPLQ